MHHRYHAVLGVVSSVHMNRIPGVSGLVFGDAIGEFARMGMLGKINYSRDCPAQVKMRESKCTTDRGV